MELFPDPADQGSDGESDDTCYERGSDDKSEEVPEASDKVVPVDLRREVLPRDRCGAEEADQKPAIRGEILDAGAAELVELGQDASSRAVLLVQLWKRLQVTGENGSARIRRPGEVHPHRIAELRVELDCGQRVVLRGAACLREQGIDDRELHRRAGDGFSCRNKDC